MAQFFRVSKQPTIFKEEEGALRPIIGEETFKGLGGVFGQEQIISPEQFASRTLGTPIGAEFVKSPVSPTVFQAGDALRPIESEEAFRQLTGTKLGAALPFELVATVPEEQVARMPRGEMITARKEPAITQPITREPKTVAQTGGVVQNLMEVAGVTPEREAEKKGFITKLAERLRVAPKETAEARIASAEEYGLTEKEAAVSGILEKATNLKTQYLKGIEQLRAKPISTALIRGREGLLQRQMSIELQGLAALADIAQGEVEAATTKINQAVEDALAVEQGNIDALKIEMAGLDLSDMEKLRFDFMLSERSRLLEKESTLASEKSSIIMKLAEKGIFASSLDTTDTLLDLMRANSTIEEFDAFKDAMGFVRNPLTGEYEKKPVKPVAPKIKTGQSLIGTPFFGMTIEQLRDVSINEEPPEWFLSQPQIVNLIRRSGGGAAIVEWNELRKKAKEIGEKPLIEIENPFTT